MLVELGLLVVTLFLWLYWYIAKNFGKWEKLGIPCISGSFPWGSHKGNYHCSCVGCPSKMGIYITTFGLPIVLTS